MRGIPHSPGGARRLAQMSDATFFVLVEGWSDRGFYCGVCTAALAGTGKSFTVFDAEEISGGSGGKEKLLSFFNELLGRAELNAAFKGKTTIFLFFLDKDLDDLRNALVQSPHVVYTKHYHMENYIFLNGDLFRALRGIALDDGSSKQILGEPSEWCRAAAECWRMWVKFCVCTALDGISCRSSYRTHSLLNTSKYGAVDPNALATCQQELETRHPNPPSASARLAAVGLLVDEAYDCGEQDRFFKGKWYAGFLAEHVSMAARQYRSAGALPDQVRAAAAATLEFSAPWAAHLREPVSTLAQQA